MGNYFSPLDFGAHPLPRMTVGFDQMLIVPYSEHDESQHKKIRHKCLEDGCQEDFAYRRDLYRHERSAHGKDTHEKETPRKRVKGPQPARRRDRLVVSNQTEPRTQGRIVGRPQFDNPVDPNQISDHRRSLAQNEVTNHSQLDYQSSVQDGSWPQGGTTGQPRFDIRMNPHYQGPGLPAQYGNLVFPYPDDAPTAPPDSTGELLWPYGPYFW